MAMLKMCSEGWPVHSRSSTTDNEETFSFDDEGEKGNNGL